MELRESIEPIGVVGLGNMGMSVLGALLARGLRVVACDLDEEKLEALAAGRSVVPEEGAEAVLKRAVQEGRLTVERGVARADQWGASFVAVQTPAEEGRCDYRALRAVLDQLAVVVRDGHLLMVGSTIFPGAVEQEILPRFNGCAVDLVYQPVFLRAGFGIDDYLHPGKVILGVRDPVRPPEKLQSLIRRIILDVEPRYVTYAESEWIKLVHNAFMSVKIAFVNEIALLCDGHPVRPERVVDLALSESKYGRLLTRSHTKPGVPFSGPCLPKDAEVLRGMAASSRHADRLLGGLCAALVESNQSFRRMLVDRWLSSAEGGRGPLGVVGTSFRPGFNEMRCSLALDFIRAARRRGIDVLLSDPQFEGLAEAEYKLACRQDEELLSLRDLFAPLRELWRTSKGVFLNRRLEQRELAQIDGLPTPPVVDVYENFPS